MDIRDIKEEVTYPKCGLDYMFQLQKELLDAYIGIESLPPYPIDINTREAQVLIKDFNGRIIEELGEGWESYEIMMKAKDYSNNRESLIPHLQNYNEEVADAIHFWLELMIYSGFERAKMRSWIMSEMGEAYSINSDYLDLWLELGKYSIGLEYPKYPAFWVIRDDDLNDEFLRGGRMLGAQHKMVQKQLLWDITYHLQIARNTLKNKPWKQTEMMTDEQLYEQHTKNATIALFRFFAFAGFTKESIYTIYFKKNKVNQFRIQSKY